MENSVEQNMMLNRETRRALSKQAKSATMSMLSMSRESASESLNKRANRILEESEKPFEITIPNGAIDIIKIAVYLVCKDSELKERISDLFYSNLDITNIVSLKDKDIEIDIENNKDIMYYAEKSKDAGEYLKLYKMCQLDTRTSMQTCISATLSVAVYTYMQSVAIKKKEEGKKRNVLANIKKEITYKSKDETEDKRFDILNMCIMLYWACRNSLIDRGTIKSEIGIDFQFDLPTIIEMNVPESKEYEIYLKGSQTFEDAIIKSGDLFKLESNKVEYYRGICKCLRATLLESSIISKRTIQMVDELRRSKKAEEDLSEKVKLAKKARTEAQKETKSVKKQMAELEKQINKLKIDLANKDKQFKLNDLKDKDIDSLKSQLGLLEIQLRDSTHAEESNRKTISELKSTIEIMSRRLNYTLNLYEDSQRYIEELTGKGEINYDIPIDIVISNISDKKIAICGGRDELLGNLEKTGLKHVKQFPVGKIPSTSEFGAFDCLVIITKQVAHKSIAGIKQHAKDTGKPIIYFNGSNIESLCREIYNTI